MEWFNQLCRNTGLMVHNIIHPDKDESQTTQVRHDVQEKQVDPQVTLRRTTIEEIQLHSPKKKTPQATDPSKKDDGTAGGDAKD